MDSSSVWGIIDDIGLISSGEQKKVQEIWDSIRSGDHSVEFAGELKLIAIKDSLDYNDLPIPIDGSYPGIHS